MYAQVSDRGTENNCRIQSRRGLRVAVTITASVENGMKTKRVLACVVQGPRGIVERSGRTLFGLSPKS